MWEELAFTRRTEYGPKSRLPEAQKVTASGPNPSGFEAQKGFAKFVVGPAALRCTGRDSGLSVFFVL